MASGNLSPSVIKASGAGKAYQSVAQSTAIAIGDASMYLRNIQTISSTAAATAIAKFLSTENPEFLAIVPIALAMVSVAGVQFTTIGIGAGTVLRGYPSG